MNSFLISLAIVCYLAIGIFARPGYDYQSSPGDYNFNYGVDDPNTGDRKQHQEVRLGKVVKGSYSLDEPDGTRRIVEYGSAPHTSFNAVVKRVGQAYHPRSYYKHGVGGFYGAEIGKIGMSGKDYRHRQAYPLPSYHRDADDVYHIIAEKRKSHGRLSDK